MILGPKARLIIGCTTVALLTGHIMQNGAAIHAWLRPDPVQTAAAGSTASTADGTRVLNEGALVSAGGTP